MPATVKPNLKPEAAKDKTHAVRIRVITPDRKISYYDTGVRIAKGNWNKKATYENENWIKTGHREHDLDNTTLKYDLDGIKALTKDRSLSDCTADEYILAYKGQIAGIADLPGLIAYSRKNGHPRHKAAITGYQQEQATGRSNTGYIAFFDTYIARKYAINKEGTAQNYQTKLNTLKALSEGKTEKEILTPEFTHHAQAALLAKHRSPGYINDTIKAWSHVFSKALPAGHVPQMPDPFDIQPLPEHEKQTDRPDSDIIQKLQELPLTWQSRNDARNTFLLQFFLHGARVSEVIKLKWSDVTEETISYLPGKRAKRIKVVPRNAAINTILDQYRGKTDPYVLPYIQPADLDKSGNIPLNTLRNYIQQVNNGLKKISEMLGITPKLTSHKIRHTFADVVLDATNDLREAQALIGHDSLQSTEIYAKRLDQTRIAERSKSIYEKFSKP